jgi:diketogulonate reductase-like aldo/keto reductase
MPFSEAVQRCSAGCSDSLPSLLASGERYYLRSVGLDVRKDAADFPSLFPDLAAECALLPSASRAQPCLVDVRAYHSSVLRLASDDTQLWTHFDVMDNMLAQVTGRKRVVLWPPTEDENLYVEGSSSRVAYIDRWNDAEFPLYRRSVHARTEAELGPGDVLFIPALWFHNVTSIGFSVALNVFWRSHHGCNGTGLYDPKDLYGNRDPPRAMSALDHVAAASAALSELPQPFRSFYARRAARELLQVAEAAEPSDRIGGSDVPRASVAGGPRVILNSGESMPLLGIGTWEAPSSDVSRAVETALASGVRHIDCAASYRNEAAVGAALGAVLANGRVRREELFVTSKLWNSDHTRVRDACIASLRALQLDRLDLYLVHWPPRDASAMLETWRQMEALVAEGLVASIGVCNCSVRKLQAIVDAAPAVLPAVNQVEAHPGWRNEELLAYCQSHGVHLTAFAPLGRGAASGLPSLLESDSVVAVAEALGCTPAQALLRWGLRRGTSVIPKSVTVQRVAENAHPLQPSDPATEAEWLAKLDFMPQQRRLMGEYLVGRGEARHSYSSVAELWD